MMDNITETINREKAKFAEWWADAAVRLRERECYQRELDGTYWLTDYGERVYDDSYAEAARVWDMVLSEIVKLKQEGYSLDEAVHNLYNASKSELWAYVLDKLDDILED